MESPLYRILDMMLMLTYRKVTVLTTNYSLTKMAGGCKKWEGIRKRVLP